VDDRELGRPLLSLAPLRCRTDGPFRTRARAIGCDRCVLESGSPLGGSCPSCFSKNRGQMWPCKAHGQTDVVRGWRQREVLTVGVATPTGASTAVAHSAVAGRPHATGLSRGGSLCRCRPRRGVCRAGRRRHRASGDVQFTSLSSTCPPSVSSPPLWHDPRVSGHRLAARARQCLRVLGSVPPARLGPPPPSFILPSAGGVGLPPSRSTMRGHDGQKLQSRPPGPAPVFNDCRRRLAPVARRRVRQPTAAADTMRGRDGQDGRWWRSWRVWRCRRTDAPQRRPRLDERHRPRTGRQTDLGRAR